MTPDAALRRMKRCLLKLAVGYGIAKAKNAYEEPKKKKKMLHWSVMSMVEQLRWMKFGLIKKDNFFTRFVRRTFSRQRKQ